MKAIFLVLTLCLGVLSAQARLSEFKLGGGSAAPPPPSGGVDSMSDDFTTDTFNQYQEVSAGTGYVVTADGGYYRPTNNFDYTTWIYTTDINSSNQYVEATGEFGQRLAVTARGSYNGGLYTGYYVTIEAGGINVRYCNNEAASSTACQQIGFAGGTYNLATPYTLRFEIIGNNYEVFVNAGSVLTGTDSTFNPIGKKIGAGHFAGTNSAGAKITSLQGGNTP